MIYMRCDFDKGDIKDVTLSGFKSYFFKRAYTDEGFELIYDKLQSESILWGVDVIVTALHVCEKWGEEVMDDYDADYLDYLNEKTIVLGKTSLNTIVFLRFKEARELNSLIKYRDRIKVSFSDKEGLKIDIIDKKEEDQDDL